MIERNNSHLDVDRLVLKIQDAVARREVEGHLEPLAVEAPRPDAERTIRILLATAEQKSEARASWSSRLNFFPFTNPRVQSVFLRSLAFIFKDQRHVNLSLVEAMRSLLAVNEALRARLDALEAAPRFEPLLAVDGSVPLAISNGASTGSIGGFPPVVTDGSDDVEQTEAAVSPHEADSVAETSSDYGTISAPAGLASPAAVAAPDSEEPAEPLPGVEPVFDVRAEPALSLPEAPAAGDEAVPGVVGFAEANVPATAHSAKHEAATE